METPEKCFREDIFPGGELQGDIIDSEWRDLGHVTSLTQRRCRRLYAKLGKSKDLVLISYRDKFTAMEAWCSHYGGPLFQGDIEDYKGSPHIMCPWHGYMFSLENGTSDIGIMQEVFETKVEEGRLYIQYPCDLQTEPYPE